ncbi:MAG: thioesterase [Caldilinea sp. CFX5]|nr:thioesterase [Caldilinea sp. CFX5]
MTHSTSSGTSQWIRVFPSKGAVQLRLVCFSHAGGSAALFNDWPYWLPPGLEVCAVQLPGREQRILEPPFVRMPALIAALVDNLIPFLQIPYVFFGHSMGALVSFEAARALRRRQEPGPMRLFVAAHRAPHLPDPNPALHRLPDPEFLRLLADLGGMSAEALNHRELQQLVLPTLRADFAVCETYLYSDEPPLSCPIVAYGGSGDKRVGRTQLLAWKQHSTAGFTMRIMPGDHFFVLNRQHALLNYLVQDLS